MSLQGFLVILLAFGALGYLIHRLRPRANKQGCGGTCSGCNCGK